MWLRNSLYSIAYLNLLVSHLGAIYCLVVGISFNAALYLLVTYIVRMLATTVFFHRFISHKSFCPANRWVTYIGCFIACSAGQMGPSWWKVHHLNHHKYTDTNEDPHSPIAPHKGIIGLLYAEFAWVLVPKYAYPDELPIDIENDPILKLMDRLHFIPSLSLAYLSLLMGGMDFFLALCLSTTLLFHSNGFLNSIGHLYGKQDFMTKNSSRNNSFVAVLTLGDGWHNSHHAFPKSARHGYQVRHGRIAKVPDPTFWLIQLMGKLKLCHSIIEYSDDFLETKIKQK
ncbi:MAG: acyl-CoA desaturase [Snowella sp.]|jgi:stearoyl-CoA desaturase (delta-9 desaturase)|nr:acyl-CoA desaturase [Snowella sp.]PZV27773.1 MAG: delta 9 acyl-lipid fatty acid desaturase [Snowella sp.]